jgi:Spy/CpxP family protein refolding chaperone
MRKWTIALYLLAIFSAGAVSGWVVAAKAAKQKMATGPRPEEMAASYRELVHAKVNLTPEQAKRVDTVIDRSSKDMQSIMGECGKRIRQCRNERSTQINALLSPEQQKEFEKLEKERRGREPWRGKGAPHDWRKGPRDRSRTNNFNRDGSQPVAITNNSKLEN